MPGRPDVGVAAGPRGRDQRRRVQPGIGAGATLAVIASGPGSVTLPARFQVPSKAVPGISAQTFELAAATTFATPTSVAAPPVAGAKSPPHPEVTPRAAGTPELPPHGIAPAVWEEELEGAPAPRLVANSHVERSGKKVDYEQIPRRPERP